MKILTIKNLRKAYGDNKLFENATMRVHDKERVVILGQNGKGKTTLIKSIVGEEDFEGTIDIKQGLKISVMEQEKEFSRIDKSYFDFVQEKKDKHEKRITEYEEKFADQTIYEDMDKYDKLMREYESICLVNYNIAVEKLKSIIVELGFDIEILSKSISKLSGGQQTAIRLADSLAKEHDLLILDEPTNHLDFQAIKYVEQYLKDLEKSIIVVTHDRYFINRFATKIVEIENKQLITYHCNYDEYLVQRVNHRTNLQNEHQSIEQQKKRLDKTVQDKRKWAHVNGNKSMRIQADRLQRDRDGLKETVNVSKLEDKYSFKFMTKDLMSYLVYEVKGLSKSYGEKQVFSKVSFDVNRRERLAIIANNGVGKTTLLKCIIGEEQYSGFVKSADGIKIGYLNQNFEELPMDKKIFDYILDGNEHLSDYGIVGVAQKFGFSYDLHRKRIRDLSGGEKQRLQMVKLVLSKTNVLILDEPTNHLDLELRRSLENAIKEYPGIVVFVSHDRYFIDKVATHVLLLRSDGCEKIEGNYSLVY